MSCTRGMWRRTFLHLIQNFGYIVSNADLFVGLQLTEIVVSLSPLTSQKLGDSTKGE